MPVSRNLSLPSSIERKFKKRPEELHDLKHCLSVPCNSQNINGNNNSPEAVDGVSQNNSNLISPVHFHSAVDKDSPRELKPPGVTLNPITRSSVTRPTLSQPCLSERSSAGATSIFPHLFLGSQKDVSDKEMLKENDITNVLNVSCNCARPDDLDDSHFRRIAVNDNYQETITPHLDEAVKFIETARRRHERVLVHCLAGVSRSATVAIAYVMYYLRLNFDDAYRFVKGKRKTISPNFNFLGQLMEFENKLRDQGHMDKPRTSSIPNDEAPNFGIPILPKDDEVVLTPMLHVTKPVSKPLRLEATVLTKPCIVTPSTTPSSFCRRRKGPALEKLKFSKDSPSVSASSDSNDFNRRCHRNVTSPGGAGVVLDLRVSVPPSEPHSRRLGSDGVEDDDETEATFEPTTFSHKSNSLPRCRQSRCNVYATSPALMSNTFRSSTAPNTPVILQTGNNNNSTAAFYSPRAVVLSARERLFPPDVEMTNADDDVNNLDVSPPSPQRSRSQTDPSHLAKPGVAGQRENYSSSLSSQLPGKFVSRKTRSPKVLKKSFNLNLRPPYGYQAFRSTKQLNLQAPIPYRNRNQDTACQATVSLHCESPNADGISSLTLYSPGIVKSDPMEVVGKSCLQANADKSNSSSGPASYCSNNSPSTRGVPNAVRRNRNTIPSSNLQPDALKPFRLVASTDLKPRWRNRHRSKASVTGSTTSTTANAAPVSPTVLNHCNNKLGIISCS